jgi:glyoxylase I family protein
VKQEDQAMPKVAGIGHVALTVSDLSVSVPWYQRLLGSEPVLDEDTGPFYHVAFALPNGTLLGLHQFPEGTGGQRFDERRPGLDHVSFVCASRGDLEGWQERLTNMGIRHGGIIDASYGSALSFRDPDNIALEFFLPPA